MRLSPDPRATRVGRLHQTSSTNDIINYTKKNGQTQKYYVITSRYALLQGYMRVGYSPQYIYYELLVKYLCIIEKIL